MANLLVLVDLQHPFITTETFMWAFINLKTGRTFSMWEWLWRIVGIFHLKTTTAYNTEYYTP